MFATGCIFSSQGPESGGVFPDRIRDGERQEMSGGRGWRGVFHKVQHISLFFFLCISVFLRMFLSFTIFHCMTLF